MKSQPRFFSISSPELIYQIWISISHWFCQNWISPGNMHWKWDCWCWTFTDTGRSTGHYVSEIRFAFDEARWASIFIGKNFMIFRISIFRWFSCKCSYRWPYHWSWWNQVREIRHNRIEGECGTGTVQYGKSIQRRSNARCARQSICKREFKTLRRRNDSVHWEESGENIFGNCQCRHEGCHIRRNVPR